MKCSIWRTVAVLGKNNRAFTVMEFVVTSFIVVLMATACAVFMQATGVSMLNLGTQSGFNQDAGHGTEFLISRIRVANTASSDAAGDSLTLSFDDNPDVDSDGDKIAWNDVNHSERFQFLATDGNTQTLEDNCLSYMANVAKGTSTNLVQSGVRKLPNLPVFSVVDTATVVINFGLLYTNQTVHSQAVEIRTTARLRNKRE